MHGGGDDVERLALEQHLPAERGPVECLR